MGAVHFCWTAGWPCSRVKAHQGTDPLMHLCLVLDSPSRVLVLASLQPAIQL